MKTVYARLPENPNVTLKLRVSSEDDTKQPSGRGTQDVYERHFTLRSSSGGGKNVGLLFDDVLEESSNPPFSAKAVQKAPLRGIVNATYALFDGAIEKVDRINGVNKILVNAIAAWETNETVVEQTVEEWSRGTAIMNTPENIDTIRQATLQYLGVLRQSRITPGSTQGGIAPIKAFIGAAFGGFRKEFNQDDDESEAESEIAVAIEKDVNALAATLQEKYEQLVIDGEETVENMVDEQLLRYFGDGISKGFTWTDDTMEKTMQLALAWLSQRSIAQQGGEAETRENTPRTTPQVTPRTTPTIVVPPIVIPNAVARVSEEQLFVRRLEHNIDETLRRALTPLYHFIGGLAVALSDSDVRRFYKYKCHKGVTVEELQSPLKRGNKSIIEFYESNKHLGDVLLQHAVDVQVRKDRLLIIEAEKRKRNAAAYEKEEAALSVESQLIGVQDDVNFAPMIQPGQEFRDSFSNYAKRAALLPTDGNHPDIATWYYCALPYSAFVETLSSLTVSAMEMAASDIWRFTGRDDFTIPLMIKSVDTRDIFIMMTRNKYLISTGSIYSDSMYVNQGGGVTKRLQTGSGSIIREKRAAENLAGKHWWQDVALVKTDPNPERRARLQRFKEADKRELQRLTNLKREASRYRAAFDSAVTEARQARGQVREFRLEFSLLKQRIKGLSRDGELPDELDGVIEANANRTVSNINDDPEGEAEKYQAEIDKIRLRLHCYDTMMYHLAYIYKGAPYGGGSFTRQRRHYY